MRIMLATALAITTCLVLPARGATVNIPYTSFTADGAPTRPGGGPIGCASGAIPAELEQRYIDLRKRFVAEAMRLIKVTAGVSMRDFNDKNRRANRQGRQCRYSKLGCLRRECAKLLGDKCPTWFIQLYGKYVPIADFVTPLQDKHYGPYSRQSLARLERLQVSFFDECLGQYVDKSITAQPRLLSIALKASSVMVRNLTRPQRAALFAKWDATCKRTRETATQATVRFLLSATTRRVKRTGNGTVMRYSSPGAWNCPVYYGIIPVDRCGTVYYRHSEEKRVDMTSWLARHVRPLDVAIQARRRR